MITSIRSCRCTALPATSLPVRPSTSRSRPKPSSATSTASSSTAARSASQEYARRFQNQAPDAVGAAAYAWLSRGLIEAIEAFIAKAVDNRFSLRVAIYEFQWPAILEALRQAQQRGADVQVVFDAIDNAKHDPVAKNEEAIDAAHITGFCHGFTNGKIMHNKFIRAPQGRCAGRDADGID